MSCCLHSFIPPAVGADRTAAERRLQHSGWSLHGFFSGSPWLSLSPGPAISRNAPPPGLPHPCWAAGTEQGILPKIPPNGFFIWVDPAGLRGVARGSFGSGPAVWQAPALSQPICGQEEPGPCMKWWCIKSGCFSWGDGTPRDTCGAMCPDNGPGPLLCMEEPFSWLFLLCDPIVLARSAAWPDPRGARDDSRDQFSFSGGK